jgi:DNA-binding transcriptional ArsR family regulator
MPGDADIAAVGALLGDRARTRILAALGDGRALAASVLALEAGVAASTASEHLAKLVDGGLLACERHGRHRYYRMAGPDVARLLEAMARLAPPAPVTSLREGTRAHALRVARTCYDHLAGQVGMAVTDSLTQHGHLEPEGARDWQLTSSGEQFCRRLGVDVEGARRTGSRHFARQCLDWSERRPHISGSLGAAIADTFFKKGWAERLRRGRTVRLTDSGRRALGSHFGTSV